MSERRVPVASDTAHWGPYWYLDDLASAICWGGGAIEKARLVGAALGVAEPPGQVWVSLEVGVVGDRDGGWDSWRKGGEGLETQEEPSPALGQAPPAHPGAPQAPLTDDELRKVQEVFAIQGVYKDAAHERVQGGLLGLGAPQPCQETCGDPRPPDTRPSLSPGQGIRSPFPPAPSGPEGVETCVRGGRWICWLPGRMGWGPGCAAHFNQ